MSALIRRRSLMELIHLSESIRSGDRRAATQIVREAIYREVSPRAILDSLVAGMDSIGAAFQRGEVFVPEMLIASRAMKECMTLLEPTLDAAGIQPDYVAMIGTVQGDLHDIGKNLVAMMWRGANFEVIDLGTNVTPEQFVEEAYKHQPHLIGISALLTTTMPAMKETVARLKEANLRGAKIIIGGAPVTKEFSDQIGADAFAPDAAAAVDIARNLLGMVPLGRE